MFHTCTAADAADAASAATVVADAKKSDGCET